MGWCTSVLTHLRLGTPGQPILTRSPHPSSQTLNLQIDGSKEDLYRSLRDSTDGYGPPRRSSTTPFPGGGSGRHATAGRALHLQPLVLVCDIISFQRLDKCTCPVAAVFSHADRPVNNSVCAHADPPRATATPKPHTGSPGVPNRADAGRQVWTLAGHVARSLAGPVEQLPSAPAHLH